ncbi:hypothetical protein AAHA92_18178 [Salvia divinorum]|uniref:Uncharacterized protein n=1 Tax=Salvia divinorum TaxID=28513 RepID=A0ABD1H4T8_SALDI
MPLALCSRGVVVAGMQQPSSVQRRGRGWSTWLLRVVAPVGTVELLSGNSSAVPSFAAARAEDNWEQIGADLRGEKSASTNLFFNSGFARIIGYFGKNNTNSPTPEHLLLSRVAWSSWKTIWECNVSIMRESSPIPRCYRYCAYRRMLIANTGSLKLYRVTVKNFHTNQTP